MIPVILSGGSGTRLWPVSRATHPKQFVEILGEPLLAGTLRRLEPLGSPWVVSVARHRALTLETMRRLGVPEEQALFEPAGRNTAPAVALLCRHLMHRGLEEEVVGIFPADHRVRDEEELRQVCALAVHCAQRDQVVTLGVRPTYPATGYGYIEVEPEAFAQLNGSDGAHRAFKTRSFHEKPDLTRAEQYLARGGHYWNAGMFIFRVRVMADSFERLMPALWKPLSELDTDLGNLDDIYRRLPAESLDYGIMEKLADQVSIPCDLGWSDLGSWDEVARLAEEAAEVSGEALPGESHQANTVTIDGRDNFVFPRNGARTYGLVGVSDLLVVDTPDALLIAQRGESQQVKALVDTLGKRGVAAATQATPGPASGTPSPPATQTLGSGASEERPWGRFFVLSDTPSHKSKILQVDPHQRLSYQSHEHRSEHWVIVRGRPEVVLDGEILHPQPGDHVLIPQGARHRIQNPTAELVEIVEVQVGTYFGEDDIVRYEDDYSRV